MQLTWRLLFRVHRGLVAHLSLAQATAQLTHCSVMSSRMRTSSQSTFSKRTMSTLDLDQKDVHNNLLLMLAV